CWISRVRTKPTKAIANQAPIGASSAGTKKLRRHRGGEAREKCAWKRSGRRPPAASTFFALDASGLAPFAPLASRLDPSGPGRMVKVTASALATSYRPVSGLKNGNANGGTVKLPVCCAITKYSCVRRPPILPLLFAILSEVVGS